jgi:hypothetical protein
VQRKVSVGVASAGVIAMATGAFLGVTSHDEKTDAFGVCMNTNPKACISSDAARAAEDRIHASYRHALEANIAFGAAAALAIGAGVLWFTGGPDTSNVERLRVVPSLAPDGPSVQVRGYF